MAVLPHPKNLAAVAILHTTTEEIAGPRDAKIQINLVASII
jgi:hypothetical protein